MTARTRTLVVAVVAAVALALTSLGAAVGLAWSGPGMGSGMGAGHGVGMGASHSMTTASSEAGFLVEMVAHHEEAIAAARQLERSARPEMRAFGAQVVAAQSDEVRRMRGWLADWYPEQSLDADYTPMMRDLSGLEGDALDEAFLQDMVGHHMTAVMMSQHLLVGGRIRHAQVDDLATGIRDTQRAEIVQMRAWLAEWFDTSPFGHGWMGPMSFGS